MAYYVNSVRIGRKENSYHYYLQGGVYLVYEDSLNRMVLIPTSEKLPLWCFCNRKHDKIILGYRATRNGDEECFRITILSVNLPNGNRSKFIGLMLSPIIMRTTSLSDDLFSNVSNNCIFQKWKYYGQSGVSLDYSNKKSNLEKRKSALVNGGPTRKCNLISKRSKAPTLSSKKNLYRKNGSYNLIKHSIIVEDVKTEKDEENNLIKHSIIVEEVKTEKDKENKDDDEKNGSHKLVKHSIIVEDVKKEKDEENKDDDEKEDDEDYDEDYEDC